MTFIGIVRLVSRQGGRKQKEEGGRQKRQEGADDRNEKGGQKTVFGQNRNKADFLASPFFTCVDFGICIKKKKKTEESKQQQRSIKEV